MADRLLTELKQIQAKRKPACRKNFSKLDAYRKQIETLHGHGASREDIRIWLRQKAGVEVTGSTISRALKRWKTEQEG